MNKMSCIPGVWYCDHAKLTDQTINGSRARLVYRLNGIN